MGFTVTILLKEMDYEAVLCLGQKPHVSCQINHWLHDSKDDKFDLFSLSSAA